MYKIRKIDFKNHPILGNLKLDFCDSKGKTLDTIIFAGENGTGKSMILKEINKIATEKVDSEICLTVEDSLGKESTIEYYFDTKDGKITNDIRVKYNGKSEYLNFLSKVSKEYPFKIIYSDVEVNFKSNTISSVTSTDLDNEVRSIYSSPNLATEIKQLLVNVQALDDSEIAYHIRKNPDFSYSELNIPLRMDRFTNAFNLMFNELQYEGIVTRNNQKIPIFTKFKKEIELDFLSSGEKQIVYRGCFLLKNKDALKGAFVCIDEPEISLHPNWQKDIVKYYKNMFTDVNGLQTSQIFFVTHSPFLIHNNTRINSKVIVLKRTEEGEIVVQDTPSYYSFSHEKIIQEAFNIDTFNSEKPIVYLEGKTDEQYFNKALEVYNYKEVPFEFKWVGYVDEQNQDKFTGEGSLKNVKKTYEGLQIKNKTILLFDSDVSILESSSGNVYVRKLQKYSNSRFSGGIENSLILEDDFEVESFYREQTKENSDGGSTVIKSLDKVRFCDHICGQEENILRNIFNNLNKEIKALISLFEK